MATSLGSIGSIHEGRRPTPVHNPPTRGEIKKLRDRLLTYGRDESRALTPEACEFIASAVVAPAAVRAQLNRPNIRPTATGHLEVVYATVPIDCVIPDPGNGRVVGATAWPAADQSAGQTLKLWAPSDLHAHPDSSCEVLVQADTVTELKQVLEEAAERTKQLNPKMREKIERDGVLDPLLCQLMHVQTADGHSAVAFVTRDGSTRCSFAKAAHRALAHDALFGPVRDLDFRRQRCIEMKRRYEAPADQVGPVEMIELRTYLVDIQIVVGFVSHDEQVNVIEAVDDIVRRTHVETSLPWLQVAQDNSQADQVLSALRGHEIINRNEFLLYGGKLSREERVACGYASEPDRVFAEMLITFGANASRAELDDVHQVIRRATGWGKVTNLAKSTIAGSLGLRQFGVEGRSLQAANTTLEETLRLDALWEQPWENTEREPAELLAAAIAELEDAGVSGPACRELLVKAAGHLASQGWLRAQISGARGLERDQRQPSVVLDAMHCSKHGLEVLAEALAAGRRGADARAVDVDGNVIERGGGDPHPLTNEWIRGAFKETDVAETASKDGPALTPQTPRERIGEYMRKAEKAAINLGQALDAAVSVQDEDGTSYLDRWGWSRGQADQIAGRLRGVAQRLETYGLRGEIAQNLPPVGPVEQLGIDAVLEDVA